MASRLVAENQMRCRQRAAEKRGRLSSHSQPATVLGANRHNSGPRTSMPPTKVASVELEIETTPDQDRTLSPEEAEAALLATLLGENAENATTSAPSALPTLADDTVGEELTTRASASSSATYTATAPVPPPTKPRRRHVTPASDDAIATSTAAAETSAVSAPGGSSDVVAPRAAVAPPALPSRGGSNTSLLSTDMLPASNPFSDNASVKHMNTQASLRSTGSYSYLDDEGNVNAEERDGVTTPVRMRSRCNTLTTDSASENSSLDEYSLPPPRATPTVSVASTASAARPTSLATATAMGSASACNVFGYASPERLSAKRHTVAELGLATPSKRRDTRPSEHEAASDESPPTTPSHDHPVHSVASTLATPHRGRRQMFSPESKYVCSPGFGGTRAIIAARKPDNTLAEDRARLERILLGATKMAVMFNDETDRIEPLYTRKAAQAALDALPVTETPVDTVNTRQLSVLKLALPLHWWASIRFPERTSVFFFASVSCGAAVYATRMLRVDGMHRPTELVFDEPLEFEHVGPDFAVTVALYGYIYETAGEEPRSGLSTPKKALEAGRRAARRLRSATPKKLQKVRHFLTEKFNEARGHGTASQVPGSSGQVGTLPSSAVKCRTSTTTASTGHDSAAGAAPKSLPADMTDFELVAATRVTLADMQSTRFPLRAAQPSRAFPVGEVIGVVSQLGSLVTVDRASYLSVQEDRLWVRRWVVLEGGYLRLYDEPKAADVLNTIDLAHMADDGLVTRKARQECARPRAFDLTGTSVLGDGSTSHVELRMAADTKELLEDWIDALRANVANLKAWGSAPLVPLAMATESDA